MTIVNLMGIKPGWVSVLSLLFEKNCHYKAQFFLVASQMLIFTFVTLFVERIWLQIPLILMLYDIKL